MVVGPIDAAVTPEIVADALLRTVPLICLRIPVPLTAKRSEVRPGTSMKNAAERAPTALGWKLREKKQVAPGEICVLPRGLKFRVELLENAARGYICENYGAHLRLPELGPIGANGLANSRDFLTPVAAFEDRDGNFQVVAKFLGRLWTAEIDHSGNPYVDQFINGRADGPIKIEVRAT